ncbi:MAG: hypothetical protein ACRDP7_21320, partial [Trebonia sp.]
IAGKQATGRHRLVRQIRMVRGSMRFVVDLQPAFDYARAKHTLAPDGRWRAVHLGRRRAHAAPGRLVR